MQAGDRRAEAFALGGLADCLVALGRGRVAVSLLEDAIAWEKAHGDDAGVLSDQAMLARAYAHDEQAEKVLRLVRELAASQVVLGSAEINRLVAAMVEVEVALGDPGRALAVTSRWMRDPRIAEVEGVRHSIVVLHAGALLAGRRPGRSPRRPRHGVTQRRVRPRRRRLPGRVRARGRGGVRIGVGTGARGRRRAGRRRRAADP